MPFIKGRQKTGGRKVGVTNRTTAEIREKVQMVLSDRIESLNDDLDNMDSFKRWTILNSVAKYVLPALNKNDDSVTVSGGYNITVSFEDSEAAPERDNDSEESPF